MLNSEGDCGFGKKGKRLNPLRGKTEAADDGGELDERHWERTRSDARLRETPRAVYSQAWHVAPV